MDPCAKLIGLEYLIRVFHMSMSYEDNVNVLIFDIKVCQILCTLNIKNYI